MALKIIVCAKQVPDTNEIKIDPVTKTLKREGVPAILNHDDANALEEALRIKDKYPDTYITVITMGPPQAVDMLRQCLAMGADEGILASDRALGGSDTWATSNALAATVRKVGDYDIIFAGRQAIDGDTAQVGPQMAEKLGLPQVTYVKQFELAEDMQTITVHRALEDGHEIIRIKTPCVLTAIHQLNTPRLPSMKGIMAARKKPVSTYSAADLGVDPDKEVGLLASPTNVYRSFTPVPRGKGTMLEGESNEQAEKLLIGLKAKLAI
ncbi:MAG: electron transfer flavoprotein subunit beta/FixA family protein [Clostridiales Family XIII bacterium]|nr:electron transfer flavoprotein subunit beta/FixA family protein [Clostridiales Family XIII bacterium]